MCVCEQGGWKWSLVNIYTDVKPWMRIAQIEGVCESKTHRTQQNEMYLKEMHERSNSELKLSCKLEN